MSQFVSFYFPTSFCPPPWTKKESYKSFIMLVNLIISGQKLESRAFPVIIFYGSLFEHLHQLFLSLSFPLCLHRHKGPENSGVCSFFIYFITLNYPPGLSEVKLLSSSSQQSPSKDAFVLLIRQSPISIRQLSAELCFVPYASQVRFQRSRLRGGEVQRGGITPIEKYGFRDQNH